MKMTCSAVEDRLQSTSSNMRRSQSVTTLQHVASVSGLSRIEGFDFDRADMRENRNFAALFGDRHSYVHFGFLHACPFHLKENMSACRHIRLAWIGLLSQHQETYLAVGQISRPLHRSCLALAGSNVFQNVLHIVDLVRKTKFSCDSPNINF